MVAELDSLDLDLVELRLGGSKGRPVLDVRIDRRDGEKVSVGDCEKASRAIEARLDAIPDAVPGRYVLEVSSPGMERPLKNVADWRRFAGRNANVKSVRFAAVGGYAEVQIVAVQGTAGQEEYLVRDLKGNELTLAPADVQEARLAFHWKP
ncbi:MAG: ribosome maturation factor RimP [Gemmatimonadales bacterium]